MPAISDVSMLALGLAEKAVQSLEDALDRRPGIGHVPPSSAKATGTRIAVEQSRLRVCMAAVL
jgi:hypothetical protein